jgi:hypothetical protein
LLSTIYLSRHRFSLGLVTNPGRSLNHSTWSLDTSQKSHLFTFFRCFSYLWNSIYSRQWLRGYSHKLFCIKKSPRM